MRTKSLPDFLEHLRDTGQLTGVDVEVSADLEVAEITRRVAAAGGRALLFTKVTDRAASVVTNLLGTERRIALAMGSESIDAVAESFASRLRREEFVAPRTVAAAACQQVVQLGRDIQLESLPWLRADVDDAGPTLAGAYVVTADPETRKRSLGFYSMTVTDRRLLAIHWTDRDVIARHWAGYRERGERMPIAIVVGGPPALALVAGGRWDRRLDSYDVASCLTGGAVDVADCRTLPLQVPAEAELVVEGYVDPDTDEIADGPRKDSSFDGNGSLPIDVGMVTHRVCPTLWASVSGGTLHERGMLIHAAARLELPLLKHRHPAIVDLVRPQSAPEQYAFVALDKSCASEPASLAAALWGEASLRNVKFLVLVDADVDVDDEAQVWRQVAQHADPCNDVFFPPANAQGEHASSLAIDATAKSTSPIASSTSAPATKTHDETGLQRRAKLDELSQLVSQRWADYGMG